MEKEIKPATSDVIISDNDLYSYLNELEDIEEDIKQEQAAVDSDEALEASYGDNAWVNLSSDKTVLTSDMTLDEQGLLARRKKQNTAKLLALEIRREALSQELIDLSSPLTQADIKRLILLITQRQTSLMNKYTNFINRKITSILTPHIPRPLRYYFSLYPQAMVKHPGFLYRAVLDNCKVLPFWVRPNIPYFFEQGTECQWLETNKKDIGFLEKINRKIALYYRNAEERTRKEVYCASYILQKGINTYFDLLKAQPLWFRYLYNDKKESNYDS